MDTFLLLFFTPSPLPVCVTNRPIYLSGPRLRFAPNRMTESTSASLFTSEYRLSICSFTGWQSSDYLCRVVNWLKGGGEAGGGGV